MAYLTTVKLDKSITPTVIGRLSTETGSTTITSAITAGENTINVTSVAGMAVGNILSIVHPTLFYFDQFEIIDITSLVLTVDMPSGNDYDSATAITSSNGDFAVDGSSTPVKFNFKTGIEAIPARALISRIILTIQTTTAPAIEEFGDITALATGVYLRRTTPTHAETFFNIKSNFDIAAIAYDVQNVDATGSSDFGIRARLTFTRMGSYVPLDENEDIALWVQNDLTGLIKCSATVEGVVE